MMFSRVKRRVTLASVTVQAGSCLGYVPGVSRASSGSWLGGSPVPILCSCEEESADQCHCAPYESQKVRVMATSRNYSPIVLSRYEIRVN